MLTLDVIFNIPQRYMNDIILKYYCIPSENYLTNHLIGTILLYKNGFIDPLEKKFIENSRFSELYEMDHHDLLAEAKLYNSSHDRTTSRLNLIKTIIKI